ncbi:MAG TPA: tRNA (adenosine(37)-N6)-threonylcarbamoyltransferase complex ATPase subunit type 1 TsaE [Bacilli bacterium]|jgi:tRNA threonylcarbamoyladenosine biosynthesis protein TsaE|nr:tRNA (adenosine(37)-N6)-threonylcarbamoyltransferase complex ATPase subunit type 1 TsaE [Bacilli bacterium]NLT02097.1 tRNA (adenosine(37)-N6)-threonylcarbamoyltransferase complex ATPase subunit type 1 TsaE [Acholeplasmataceae bacterium]HNZ77524.1 tRNA (adenosine(37)-N6)-threonylcarbamoyltransferase complex ATPase subunit type 1 TsaE [Bacilli bacterium]HOD61521.1 tRNA (adenosine(37)-N6)-threonylcarbamoyltransferase complex ATPase subunit type 1 TsaE [Bacilli bacterium]HOE06369.1 tRNA (adenosi
MKKEFKIKSPEQMIELGKKIGELVEENMVITLEGDLGVGKTTLTKGIALGLGISTIINSPTFTIMKIHYGRLTLYHMDVYRLNNDSGDDYLEEYFEAKGVCVIEWANNISDILPENILKVMIKQSGDTVRIVEIEAKAQQYINLLKEVNL